MYKTMITVKIDVKKLDKLRFVEGKPDKTGHKPLYCDLVLMERKDVGKYGDTHLVKQGQSKEDRLARKETPIIGSATDRGPSGGGRTPAQSQQQQGDDSIPF